MHREIETSEAIYRSVLEALGALAYTLTYETGVYDFFGADVKKLIGYDANELSWRLFAERCKKVEVFGPLREVPKERRLELEIIGEYEHIHAEVLFERKDGRLIWLADVSKPHRDANGKVVGSMGILQDISERKFAEQRAKAFAELGERLGGVATPTDAADAIARTARDLFAWDACNVNLYIPETDTAVSLLNEDIIDGVRQRVPVLLEERKPSDFIRKILFEGPQLILRESAEEDIKLPLGRFGDLSRPSISMLFAPICRGGAPIGYLSFQSYSKNAFGQRELDTVLFLADQCASGLERARMFQELALSEERFRSVWDRAGSGMRLSDSKGIIHLVNPAFCELIGLDRSQLEGKPVSVYYEERVRERVLERYRTRFEHGSVDEMLERTMRLWNGREITFQISNSFINTPGGTMLLGVFRDRTSEQALESSLRQANDELEQLATFDALTGLHNRRHLMELLSSEAARARRYHLPFCIIMLDIDHFKSINDTYGHAVGDKVLARTGKTIRGVLRQTDIPGRYGGEEFCIGMPQTSMEGGRVFAERLRRRIEEQVFRSPDGSEFRISASIGLAQLDDDAPEFVSLLNLADQRLYFAKECGRNQVCC